MTKPNQVAFEQWPAQFSLLNKDFAFDNAIVKDDGHIISYSE